MCWADKIGLTFAALIYFGLFALSNDKSAVMAFFFSGEGLKFLLLAVSPWLLFRAVDWIIGGPRRRRGTIMARVIRD